MATVKYVLSASFASDHSALAMASCERPAYLIVEGCFHGMAFFLRKVFDEPDGRSIVRGVPRDPPPPSHDDRPTPKNKIHSRTYLSAPALVSPPLTRPKRKPPLFAEGFLRSPASVCVMRVCVCENGPSVY